jgi:hypothetical protein
MRVDDIDGSMGANNSVQERLLAFYRRFVGEPERESDVYFGFVLFFGGIAFGILGLALFLWSETLTEGVDFYWQVREIAILLAMLGLPSFILSFVILLPVDRRARYASGAGVAICVVAAVVFVWAYPSRWNVVGTDYTTEGITTYAVGLAVLVASSGGGLVEQRLENARAAQASRERTEEGEEVTDEQVRRDIEEAIKDTELTWGGVERDTTKRIKINTDDVDMDRSGFDGIGGNESRSSGTGVDQAVAGLQNLQGGQKKQGKSEGVDDQTAALRELRERQQTDPLSEPSFLERVKNRLGL